MCAVPSPRNYRSNDRVPYDSAGRAENRLALLWFDVELARECRVLVFLVGEKIAKLRAAEKIDEHSLTLESIGDALSLHRIGNIARQLLQGFLWRLGGSDKAEPYCRIDIVEPIFGQCRYLRKRFASFFRGNGNRSQRAVVDLPFQIRIVRHH